MDTVIYTTSLKYALTEFATIPWRRNLAACRLMKTKMHKFGKGVHIPFSNSVCLRALASKTRTLGTGSDARLTRLGSRCLTNWSTGMHSSLTTACDERRPRQRRVSARPPGSPQTHASVVPKTHSQDLLLWGGCVCLDLKISTTECD